MKRTFMTFLISTSVLVIIGFLLLFGFVASEGYPTLQAVRNWMIQEGEIVIEMPDDLRVVSAECENPRGRVSIDGQTVTTEIGYSWTTISICFDSGSESGTIKFNPQKLNDWNRILFLPKDATDPSTQFLKFENGVEKEHHDVSKLNMSETESILAKKASVAVPTRQESLPNAVHQVTHFP
jgi:hypothetical protein